ncbi:hypothetical protein BpHYR1_052949 [Brachionus plicatilis]|uniref:Uncharacterized protein n=1 Tax=Brachionus plicatilis TaxID=10195 RepID=A0A3M7RSJ4_BRAPC|nr:hypothetical protein BpHYR1_052949 [Brachionus plicatilis]
MNFFYLKKFFDPFEARKKGVTFLKGKISQKMHRVTRFNSFADEFKYFLIFWVLDPISHLRYSADLTRGFLILLKNMSKYDLDLKICFLKITSLDYANIFNITIIQSPDLHLTCDFYTTLKITKFTHCSTSFSYLFIMVSDILSYQK